MILGLELGDYIGSVLLDPGGELGTIQTSDRSIL